MISEIYQGWKKLHRLSKVGVAGIVSGTVIAFGGLEFGLANIQNPLGLQRIYSINDELDGNVKLSYFNQEITNYVKQITSERDSLKNDSLVIKSAEEYKERLKGPFVAVAGGIGLMLLSFIPYSIGLRKD